jgi:hypothetical protein
MTIAIFFLLLEPFLLMSYSLMIYHSTSDFASQLMWDINLITIAIVALASAIQSKFAVFQNPLYALACPLGGAIISLCFLSSILDAKKVGAVNWRGRKYTINENHPPLE